MTIESLWRWLYAAVAVGLVLLTTAPAAVSAVSAVSAEAQRHFNRGMAAVEVAKDDDGYALAIDEFRQATELAPDWPDAYYNLGLIQDKAGKFRDAAAALRHYLQLAPAAPDAAAVSAMIDKAEFKAEQTLSREDVLNIFASLNDGSQWRMEGISHANDFQKKNWPQTIEKSGDSISISWNGGTITNYQPFSKSFLPSGKVLNFSTFYGMCNRENQEDQCPEIIDYRLEVVSRRKVIVNLTWHFPLIHGVGGWTKDDIAVAFVKR